MTLKKLLLLCAGFLCLGLGAVGILLPVLPTTPFVLVAAACFSGSSPKWNAFLLKSPYFGSYIENWRHKTGVPLAIKRRAVGFLWAVLLLSMVLVRRPLVIGILLLVGCAVSTHLLLLKTKPEEQAPQQAPITE